MNATRNARTHENCVANEHNQLSHHASNNLTSVRCEYPIGPMDQHNNNNNGGQVQTAENKFSNETNSHLHCGLHDYSFYCCYTIFFLSFAAFWVAKPFRLHWTHTQSSRSHRKFSFSLSVSTKYFSSRRLDHPMLLLLRFSFSFFVSLARLHARGKMYIQFKCTKSWLQAG